MGPILLAILIALVVVLTVSLGLGLGLTRTAPSDGPTPPTAPCEYGDWSDWTIECLELPNGTWAQLRSRFDPSARAACPQLYDTQICNLGSCLQFNVTQLLYGCEYDVYTNQCNASYYRALVTWYCSTNTSLVTFQNYLDTTFSVAAFFFSIEPVYPCVAECPPTNTSSMPIPAPVPSPPASCNYGDWSAWSSFCMDNAGNYSLARTREATPAADHCPQEIHRATCIYSACSEQMVVTNLTYTCRYNETTNLCANSTELRQERTYCATNATDLSNYLATTSYNGADFFSTVSPCDGVCPVSNGSVVYPSPSPESPSPSPTPACTYGAWGSWSELCGEYPPGVFSQTRTRLPDVLSPACNETLEQQDCDASSCMLWNTTSISVDCQFDVDTYACNSSTMNTTTQGICATNATNMTLYLEEVQGLDPYTVTSAAEQPCNSLCPLNNAPPPPPCDYTEWSDWSQTCFEYEGAYFQLRTRVLTTANASCTEFEQQSDCDLNSCQNNQVVLRDPGCDDYDPYTGACVTSQATLTFLSVCTTNATDLGAYYALPIWLRDDILVQRVSPCDATCPQQQAGFVPAPVPVPSPSGCASYGPWSAWSFLCVQVAQQDPLDETSIYRQYRVRQPTASSSPLCPDIVEYGECQPLGPLCQTIQYVYVSAICSYDVNGDCESSELTMETGTYCLSNATDLNNYGLYAPFVLIGINGSSSTCEPYCPSTGPGSDVLIVTTFVGEAVDLDSQLTGCQPPEWFNPTTLLCEPCTNTSACTVAQIDPEARTCTQVAKCDDGDPCTVDSCTAATGVCTFEAIQGLNLLNSSAPCVCVAGEPLSLVVCGPLDSNTPLTPMEGTGCGPSNDTYVCGYRESIQRCSCTSLAVLPTTLQATTIGNGACFAATVDTLDETTLVVPTFVLDGNWLCPSNTSFVSACIDGLCQSPYPAASGRCDYDVVVFDASTGGLQTISGRDDSVCPAPSEEAGKFYSLCMPARCSDTVTGCAQCGAFYDQGVLQYPVDCDCCFSESDCATNFTCVTRPSGNRCLPNEATPTGGCDADDDCFSASLCRTPRCNTTLSQCYFENTVCTQVENPCIARQECAPETGACVRVLNTCPPGNACQELFSCIAVDGEAVCTYADIIPIPPAGVCTIETCDPEDGWSYIPRPCDPGKTCVESQGCQFDCTLDSECTYLNSTFDCTVGLCVDGVCMRRTTCSSTTRCSLGSCVSAGCSGFTICPAGEIVNTAAPPLCPCICDPATCAQQPAPSNPCEYYGCSDDGSECEVRTKTCLAPDGCSSVPECDPDTGLCGASFPLCPYSPLDCPLSTICGVDFQCVEVNSTTCPTCPNTTTAECLAGGGSIQYAFVCDDDDICTQDSIDPNTGGCLNIRDPNCCTKNSDCLSGLCDIDNGLCGSPISGCVGSGSCAPSNPCLADYICIDGTCVWDESYPRLRVSCYAKICGELIPDDSQCDDDDTTTADLCDDEICPDSGQHCAHCSFANIPSPLAGYVTEVDYDDCSCT
jgi:hypothetical protein